MVSTTFPQFDSLRVQSATVDADLVVITASGVAEASPCPLCGRPSQSVHSRRRRVVADLPLGGLAIRLCLLIRHFFCRTPSCPRRIFAERLPALVAPGARRSYGLRVALQRIALAAGGEAGARLARTLGMPASPDTLLRLARAAALPVEAAPRVVGIDDWAYKRGARYGTIVCDLERHRVLALLPDRSADSTAAWLAARPTVEVVARDRAGLYADAARRGAPQATQVADRWHLIDNLAGALERFLLHQRPALKQAAASLAEPSQPEPVEEMYQGKRRQPGPEAWRARAEEESARRLGPRREAYAAVAALHASGADIADIARTVGVSRTTVYRYLRQGPPQPKRPTRRRRQRVLAPWEPYLLERWEQGCHTATRLWREIRTQGFAYSVTNVQRFVAQLRREGPNRAARDRSPFRSVRGPSPRRVASLLLQRPERRSPEAEAYLERLCQLAPAIQAATVLARDFLVMVRERRGEQLDAWIEAAERSEVDELRRFAVGLREDLAAIHAGLTSAYSNGQTEGQINRLKLLRRTMYGRGHVDLLQRRLLVTTSGSLAAA